MRLVTRSDFDGLVCGVLLEEAGIVASHLYCHPKDLQDGKIPVGADDVLANVPYVEGCGLWFDHHASNIAYAPEKFEGAAYPRSPVLLVWSGIIYGGEARFGRKFDDLMRDVDKVDSANLSKEEILNPSGWIILGFIMDPRTGLGRYRHFEISNYALMQKMVGLIREKSLDGIFEDPDVYARLAFYYEHVCGLYQYHSGKNSRKEGKVIIFETRNISQVMVGKSILDFTVLYPRMQCQRADRLGQEQGECFP